MCDRVLQFCSGSAKPLLFGGSLFTALVSLAIGYFACSSNTLYNEINESLASKWSLSYHLQLAASVYLIIIALLVCAAAYYDHKQLMRLVAMITILNLCFAIGGLYIITQCDSASNTFKDTLMKAEGLYDFTQLPVVEAPKPETAPQMQKDGDSLAALNMTRRARASNDDMTKELATKIWDNLQRRNCCGFANATEEWSKGIPKSCCSKPEIKDARISCLKIDEQHNFPCKEVIDSTCKNLLIVVALAALANLYLAIIAGVNAYRTFHYNEANQNAYN